MPSLTDVAQEAGVSLTTASMVLNKGKQHNRVSVACAARVQDAARRLGYVPNYHARSMKLGRAEVLAVALDFAEAPAAMDASNEVGKASSSIEGREDLELSNPYYGHLLAGIERHIRSIGYLMTLIGPDGSLRAPERALLGVKQRRFDGIIVPGAAVRDQMSSFLTEPADCPVVVIDPHTLTIHPAVIFDERQGTDLAVEHLRQLGHRHLAFVGDIEHSRNSNLRQQQFIATCSRAGIAHEIVPLGDAGRGRTRAWSTEERLTAAAEATHAFASGNQTGVTGIIAFNDVTAMGVMEGLNRAGLSVPEDVSVVGFDDTLAAYAAPRLTTVNHKLTEMGRRATELCMEMVHDSAAITRLRGSQVSVAPELRVRASTGPARAANPSHGKPRPVATYVSHAGNRSDSRHESDSHRSESHHGATVIR